MAKLQSFIALFEVSKYYSNSISELYVGEKIEIVDIHQYERGSTYIGIVRNGKNKWNVTSELRDYPDEDLILEKVINDRIQYEEPHLSFTKKEFYELEYTIEQDMDIKSLYEIIKLAREEITEAYEALLNTKLYPKVRESIIKSLHIYEKAKDLIAYEFKNNAYVVKREKFKILQVHGRVKEISSITEKVYRKGISQYEVFSELEDIAGVRVVCQYLSGVYDLVKYISINSSIRVISIKDQIENPSDLGYRGICIVVCVDVQDGKNYYNDVKVEIQIQTIFQNAWTLNTERLTYKKDSIDNEEILEEIRKLSDLFYEADKEAEVLGDKIDKLIYN